MTPLDVLPGAEPYSHDGGPWGALVLHGFTGCPQSMRPLAQAFAAKSFTVDLPRLPGHGTTVEDMARTGWQDWTAMAEAAYLSLASKCERVVVSGLSMGGALTVWLARRHSEIAGIAVINAGVAPPEPGQIAALQRQLAAQRLEEGVATIPGVGGDIKKPGANEMAYDLVPLSCLLSLFEGLTDLAGGLGEVRCPTLVLNSPEDHVVDPAQSDRIAAEVAGTVERVVLDNSYHVATLDNDAELIEESVVAFAQKVCGKS